MISGTMRREQYQWHQVLVSHLKWGAWKKLEHGLDVCRMDCGSSGERTSGFICPHHDRLV